MYMNIVNLPELRVEQCEFGNSSSSSESELSTPII